MPDLKANECFSFLFCLYHFNLCVLEMKHVVQLFNLKNVRAFKLKHPFFCLLVVKCSETLRQTDLDQDLLFPGIFVLFKANFC